MRSRRPKTHQSQYSTNRRLRLELLERRNLLAGLVTASVSGGNLVVRGDNEANVVLIAEVDDGDGNSKTHAYVVGGFDTNIQGGKDSGQMLPADVSARLFLNVKGNIDVDLKGGDDLFAVGNSTSDLSRQLDECGFLTTEADDALNAFDLDLPGQVNVPGNLIINMGSGADGVAVNASARTGIVNTGNGDDTVSVGGAPGGDGVVFRDDLIILTGNGNDHVCTENLQVTDFLNVQLGNGDFQSYEAFLVRAGHVLATSGGGNDSLVMGTITTDREIVIDSGAGDDVVEMDAFSAGQGDGPKHQRNAGNITIVTGNGDDHVFVFGDFQSGGQSAATSLLINTGSGNDGADLPDGGARAIAVQDVVLRNQLTLVTGAGDDSVDVERITSTRGGAVIDLGSGDDAATLIGLLLKADLTLILGGGVDSATLDAISVGRNAVIDAGSGDDIVDINDSHVDRGRITVLMGLGNDDILNITQSTAKKATFLGGPGDNDTFNNDLGITGNGKQGSVEVREFENFNDVVALESVDDSATITEDAVPNTVSGNVLNNDIGGIGPLAVTEVLSDPNAVGVVQQGAFGTLLLNADGTYTYTLDNTNTTVNALNNGGTLTDEFQYTVSDGFRKRTATLTITINGQTDVITQS